MQPNSFSSRFAALGLLLLAVFMVVALVVRPLWEHFASNRELIAELESRLLRFEQISNRETRLEEELAGLTKNLERSGLMLEAKSATLASALLQERVKKVVGESGGTLASTQVVVGPVNGGFQRVSVDARMTGSIGEVQSSLYGLENAPPKLVLGDLLIVARRSSARLRGQDNGADDMLDVRFQVTGFYDARSSGN